MNELDKIEIHLVTDDPEVLRDLRAKFGELGSHGLATYAHSLGLYPRGYEEGQVHSISGYRLPGADPANEELLGWDTSIIGPSDGDDDEEDEDSPDPWDTAVPPN